MAREFEASLMKQFPKVPGDVVNELVRHATAKRSGRVGRTGLLDPDERVRLAVNAHIRHRHTEYDQLLRDGAIREDARAAIRGKAAGVEKEWAGNPPIRRASTTGNNRLMRKTRKALDSEGPRKKPAIALRGPKIPTNMEKQQRRKKANSSWPKLAHGSHQGETSQGGRQS